MPEPSLGGFQVDGPHPQLEQKMIQVPPILHLVPDLPHASLDFTKHRQASAQAQAREPGLEEPLPHE